MKRLAENLHQLGGFPPNAINVYLLGDVLIDSGTKFARSRIRKQVAGRAVASIALTHAHPDHQGACRALHDELHISVACGANDADAVESGDLAACMPPGKGSLIRALLAGPACPVARRLKEGDEVGGCLVIDAPGHSPGHIAFWRESDRVLILGDVLTGMSLFTGLPGVHLPPNGFTRDPVRNCESARRLAAFEPELVCFGHGPPWRRREKKGPFSTVVDHLLGPRRS